MVGSQRRNIETALERARAGHTVIAANTRAARRLRLEIEREAFESATVCETPDVIELNAWISRTWTECLLAGVVDRALLRPNVVAALWEQIVAESDAGRELLSHRAAAELAAQAWRLIHQYKLPRTRAAYLAGPESSAFYGWASTFEARCKDEGWIDSTAAFETLIAQCSRIPKLPKQVVAFGFDQFTPAQEELWSALRSAAVEVRLLLPEPSNDWANARTLACADALEEIRTAALWARHQLEEDPRKRIGIVAPGLENLRDSIETVFEECLHPEQKLLANPRPARCFEISLGRPLDHHPMVRTALRVLRFATASLSMDEFSALLRSPYLGEGSSEASQRALLDFGLRWKLRATVTLVQVLDCGPLIPVAPRFFHLLTNLQRQEKKLPASMTRSQWAAEARRLLSTVGWPGDGPGEFTLNTGEFQATLAWDALLSSFGALDQVLPPRSPIELQFALERAAAETTFAVENEGAPIQVVGPLAASGESFDALWMCGLTDDAWPQRGHPNPFIPFNLQKAAEAPHSSPEINLRDAERVTSRLLQSAEACILSWPKREEDRELRPSPLLARVESVAREEVTAPEVTGWHELQEGAVLEGIVDEQGPALTEELKHRSTRLLEWQSGCPFRAFAQARLRADPPLEPTLGSNFFDRGNVTESALKYVWDRLREWQALDSITTAHLDAEIDAAIEQALADDFPKGDEAWLNRHREIERQRLNNLVHEWLDVERKRAPFHNVKHQEELDFKIGELKIRGRADRIEQTPDGAFIIIDYKTGSSYSTRWWDVPRPKDPQLPIYAVAQQQQGREIAGVAFAKVRAGKCGFFDEATGKEVFGKRGNDRKYEIFGTTIASWQPELERLAGNFVAGQAEVDPKEQPGNSNSPCQFCHLDSLCRVAEFAAPPDDEIEEVDDGE